jgi:D-alanine-D-alanine ligase
VAELGLPLFIKPCASGSSIGICKAKSKEELVTGIKAALLHDGRVLVEKFINARELECAVLETAEGIVAEVGEVISADEFYDFDSKYNNAASLTVTSPDITPELGAKIRRQAVEIFKILDCKSLSRVDFFLDKDTGELIFNEINTLPGFTNISMFPMLAASRGYEGARLMEALIESASL